MSLHRRATIMALEEDRPTPFLVTDLNRITRKVEEFRRHLPMVKMHYAVKANPNPSVLAHLLEHEVSFEIASIQELHALIRIGKDPADVLFSNPIKPDHSIREAYALGVTTFTADSIDEIDKIWDNAPEGKIVIRIAVNNEGSDWPLSHKFGLPPHLQEPLFTRAAERGQKIIGLTFHVGSQCRRPEAWSQALEQAMPVLDLMRRCGHTIELINMGGGFPIQHLRPIPSMAETAAHLVPSLEALREELGPDVRIVAEPGRYLVGDSSVLATKCIGRAERATGIWLYFDIGAFGGLAETLEGFDYRLITPRDSEQSMDCTIAGPSCDSVDVIFRGKAIPDLHIGDLVLIENTGAYTSAYASTFNGFPLPEVYILQIEEETEAA